MFGSWLPEVYKWQRKVSINITKYLRVLDPNEIFFKSIFSDLLQFLEEFLESNANVKYTSIMYSTPKYSFVWKLFIFSTMAAIGV